MSWIIGYIAMIVVTWMWAGFQTGKQFSKIARANPGTPVQINWGNVLYQGVTWPAFWASFVGEKVEQRWGAKGPVRADYLPAGKEKK